MKLAIIAMLFLITNNAFAKLRPESEWLPGATCWTDNNDYVMFHCNCIDSMNSNTAGMETSPERQCDKDRVNISGTNGLTDKCWIGTTEQLFAYEEFRNTGLEDELSTQTVAYICGPASASATEVCDCYDKIQHYTLQSDKKTYKATATPMTTPLTMSTTWCSYESDPDTGEMYPDPVCYGTEYSSPQQKSKTLGPHKYNTTTKYACVGNYYLSGTTCTECPEYISRGTIMKGTTSDKNTEDITSCYVPKDTPFVDDTGEGIYTGDTHWLPDGATCK